LFEIKQEYLPMPSYLILATKLNRPECFQACFKRLRQENILKQNSDKSAALVFAGASYSKNTLGSQWFKNKQSFVKPFPKSKLVSLSIDSWIT